jgi:hypothetical protein
MAQAQAMDRWFVEGSEWGEGNQHLRFSCRYTNQPAILERLSTFDLRVFLSMWPYA